MSYSEEHIAEAVELSKKYGDEYAVVIVGCDPADPVLVVNDEGTYPTPWQSYQNYVSFLIDDMVGIVIVHVFYDNDAEKWVTEVEVIENDEV